MMKVSRKRRVTLPEEVCERLGRAAGDDVRAYVDDGGRAVIEEVLSIDDLAGILNPGRVLKGLAEELDEGRRRGERR